MAWPRVLTGELFKVITAIRLQVWYWVVMCNFAQVKTGVGKNARRPGPQACSLFRLHACEPDLSLPNAQLFLDKG